MLASVLLVVFHGPAASQDALSGALEDLTSRDGIAAAASQLAQAGKNRLLVTNMLGETIKGSDGKAIGTIRDFAVIPGGRVVAVIVETGDGSRIAVPYGAVKAARSADALGLQVPVKAAEIRNMSELTTLAETFASN